MMTVPGLPVARGGVCGGPRYLHKRDTRGYFIFFFQNSQVIVIYQDNFLGVPHVFSFVTISSVSS
jgi:hypothetical protein